MEGQEKPLGAVLSETVTLGRELRDSHKLKAATRLTRGALSWPALLSRRIALGRRISAMPMLRIHVGCGRINA